MVFRWKKVFHRWLPSIISGGADNDPAGIATYAISGARFGYQQLWLLILSTPLLVSVQSMCARLGDVKRKGLMHIIKEQYPPAVGIIASLILIIANTATLGADLAAIADSLELVTTIKLVWWVVPVALFLWYIIVFKNHRVIEKYLFFLTFVFFAYVISAFLARPNWFEVLRAIVLPKFSFSLSYFTSAIALLGTTITPFLFFWQARQGIEEHKSNRELTRDAKTEDAITAPGFIYSNVMSFFIIVSTAAVLHVNGKVDILLAGDAARALEPFVGPLAKYVFAFGIIGSGLLAIPVLATSTAYAVAEAFGWRESLSDTVSKAKGFYTVLTASLIVGVGIALSGINPIHALLYSQVLGGMLAPFLIILILIMCNDKKIMGSFVNGWFDNVFGWLSVIIMVLASAGFFWQLFL